MVAMEPLRAPSASPLPLEDLEMLPSLEHSYSPAPSLAYPLSTLLIPSLVSRHALAHATLFFSGVFVFCVSSAYNGVFKWAREGDSILLPSRDICNVWRHLWLSQLRGGRKVGVPPAPSGWRPGMLLNTLQHTGCPTHNMNFLVPNINSVEAEGP